MRLVLSKLASTASLTASKFKQLNKHTQNNFSVDVRFVPVGTTLTIFKVTVYENLNISALNITQVSLLISMKCCVLSSLFIRWNMLKIFRILISKGGKSAYTIEYTFNIGLYPRTCEPISLKLNMMLGATKLYSLIQCKWPWPPLKVTGLRESANECNRSAVKRHEVTQTFARLTL